MSDSTRITAPPAQKGVGLLGAEPRHLVGLLSTWVIALLPANLVPAIIGGLVGELGVPVALAGAIATAMTLMNALGVLAMRPLVSRGHRVMVARAGVAVMALPLLAAASVMSIPVVLGALVIAGLGSGILISAATASVAATQNPDRATAVVSVVNRVIIALSFLLLPLVGGGLRTILLMLVGFAALAFVGSAWLAIREAPATELAAATGLPDTASGSRASAWALAISFAVWTVSEEGIYSVVSLLMMINLPRLTEDGSYVFFAAGAFAGILGALSAPVLLRLVDRPIGIGALLVLSIVSKLGMVTAVAEGLFLTAVILWGFAFGAMIPLVFGLAAKLSRTGSANVLVNGVYVIGVALGPLVATQVMEQLGVPGLGTVMTVIGVMAGLALVIIAARSRRIIDEVWRERTR